MKIPKYIQEHIEANNKLLAKADKHAMIVLKWYNNQFDRLSADNPEVSDEDLSEIQTNWRGNGEFDLSAIKENLELLENEMR